MPPSPGEECEFAFTGAFPLFDQAAALLTTTSLASVVDLVKSTVEDGVDGIMAKEEQSRAFSRRISSATSVCGASVGGSSTMTRVTLECDYDVNPTELYLAVQDRRWDDVVQRSNTHPREASTWVYRREEANGNSDGGKTLLRWRLLPLHAASIFRAPKEAVVALLVANPEGAACGDDQGMLPLHLYLKRRTGDVGVNEEVVSILARAYPEGEQIKDNAGRTPLDFMEGGLMRCLGVEPEVKKVVHSPLCAATLRKRQATEARIDGELLSKLERRREVISHHPDRCCREQDRNSTAKGSKAEDKKDLVLKQEKEDGEDSVGVEVEYDVDEIMMQEGGGGIVTPPTNEGISPSSDGDCNDDNAQDVTISVPQTVPPPVRLAPPSLRDQMRARLEKRGRNGGYNDQSSHLRADWSHREAGPPPPPTADRANTNDILRRELSYVDGTGGGRMMGAPYNSNAALTGSPRSICSRSTGGTRSKASHGSRFLHSNKGDVREITLETTTEEKDDASPNGSSTIWYHCWNERGNSNTHQGRLRR